MSRRYREKTAPALARSRSLRRKLRPGPEVGNLDTQRTPLFSAVQRKTGATKVCKWLIDFGGISPTHEDVFGQTALFYAAKTNNVACADVLVAKKCPVNHRDQLLDQTALFYAARHGTGLMVRRLLDLGADPCHRDKHGCLLI